ncbi:putative oxidoreductase [Pestalotiopsis sp. NC0098]|nr:putative oxidoreductase [Pestalotiopsis sp. NC0098]
MAPQLIFGTASFGGPQTAFQNADDVRTLLRALRDAGIQRLDTGARYPPTNMGRSEQLIGEAAKDEFADFIVDTKVFTDATKDGSGDLTEGAIGKSVDASLERLQRSSVNVLHVHRADPSTPLEEQIRAFNKQIAEGRCREWGVSNVPPPMLEELLQLCEKNGWKKPTCYQGQYNLVTRGMETKLLPILRAHVISYNAFMPLAAGFLTGRLVNNDHAGTRFAEDHPLSNTAQKMFGGEELFEAMKIFDEEVKAQGLETVEVALRWIAHHSALEDGDGIVIGASKVEQAVFTANFIKKGPLPDAVLVAVEDIWQYVEKARGDII